ncbi:glyoxalase/bleomycin resistance/dioxygenase family protein [Halobacteriovorax sp. GFR7]|uniref:glyoxalase/bleomycin resistance/dioxygenase family protein n=1 Tax=Bacteriovoracales TaxID=2024979 RepID=UPI000386DC52|nr:MULTISPECIES: glyoxalase/bleomycin resistance/dioxygenase family protein [Bacteriovoracales]EPZ51407.1 hypothetical protein M902_3063 [Bacteriovorax sp. BAL6_X]POB14408.1 glyoxalase/bleomycin resistance/dioxygenase family protein [Halobacteriovorax sp. DA5]
MKLGHIVLFSSNAHLTSTFLSEVFDLEVEGASDSVVVFNDELRFLVVERPKLAQVGNNIVFDFVVDNYDELIELQKKVEFVNYRLESSGENLNILSNEKIPEILVHEGVQFFFITDPDNRRWKVTLIESN